MVRVAGECCCCLRGGPCASRRMRFYRGSELLPGRAAGQSTCFVSGHAFTRAVQKPFPHLLCIRARVYACRTKTFSALALYQGTRLRVPHKNLFRTCFVSGHAFTRAVSAFNGLGLQPLKLKRRYSLRTFCCSWKKASQRVVIPR